MHISTRLSSTRICKAGVCVFMLQSGKANSGNAPFGQLSVTPLPPLAHCGIPAAMPERESPVVLVRSNVLDQSHTSPRPQSGSVSADDTVCGSGISSCMCSATHITRKTCGRINQALSRYVLITRKVRKPSPVVRGTRSEMASPTPGIQPSSRLTRIGRSGQEIRGAVLGQVRKLGGVRR